MANVLPDAEHYLSSPLIPDYFVWVTVDGEIAPVYAKVVEGNKVSGYIEAKEGKSFAVHQADLRTTSPDDSYTTRVFVDGQRCNGKITEKNRSLFAEPATSSARFRHFRGQEISKTSLRPFLFGKLETTDDDDEACADEQTIKNLGTIQARYYRVENVRTTTMGPKVVDMSTKKIHETMKKASLSHQATFGAVVERSSSSRLSCKVKDAENSPLVTYEFKYRSRQLLQLEGHVPASPTPSPRSSPTPPPIPRPRASTSSTSALDGQGSRASTSASATTPAPAEDTELARLKAELEALRRERRIAELERQVEVIENGTQGTLSSRSKRVKPDPDDVSQDIKRVKTEAGVGSTTTSSSQGKGKGKAEVLVLSDSD